MLILLRHGRTAINAEARLQGLVDHSLDAVGIEQARRAGSYIRSRFAISRVISSPMARALETLDHAGFGAHLMSVDERWREIDFGDYDQREYVEVIGELTANWRADIGYRPPGGESMAELHNRVAEAAAELALQSVNEDILVVTHAMPIKSAAVWAIGGQLAMILNLRVDLATVSVLEEIRGRPFLSEYNSGQHLAD